MSAKQIAIAPKTRDAGLLGAGAGSGEGEGSEAMRGSSPRWWSNPDENGGLLVNTFEPTSGLTPCVRGSEASSLTRLSGSVRTPMRPRRSRGLLSLMPNQAIVRVTRGVLSHAHR